MGAFMQHSNKITFLFSIINTIEYEIKDLYETDRQLFQKEAESWSISGASSEPKALEVHVSGSKSPELLLGGTNIVKPGDSHIDSIIFQRVYTGLPFHRQVTVIGKFWYFGDFSDEKEWEISILTSDSGSISVLEAPKLPSSESFSKKINLTENEMKFDFVQTRNEHSKETLGLIIKLKTKNSKQRSIGFRELTIHLITVAGVYSYEPNNCHKFEGLSLFGRLKCPCPFNQAPNEGMNCQDCPLNCATCNGAAPYQCLSCSAEGRWHGAECDTCDWNCKTCTGPTEHECSVCNDGSYNYGNGTCLETCDWPFRIESWRCNRPSCRADQYFIGFSDRDEDICVDECPSPLTRFTNGDNIKICKNPCAIESHFLYWNGSCLGCPQPLVQVSGLYGQLCQNPCELNHQYLYWNRSCLDNCPVPYQVKSEPGVNYCGHPCLNPQFFLDNKGGCHPVCRTPFRAKTENGIKYCLPPCDPNKEYILRDGSCSGECPAPLMRRTEASIGTYCLSPCESDDYFVDENGSCLLSCPDFFDVEIKYGVKHCSKPCLDDQYYFEQNKSCLGICPYPLKVISEAGMKFCQNPCSRLDDFIYDDQSCHESCPLPLLSLTEAGPFGKSCKSPCNKGDKYLNLDGSCQKKCEYPYKIVSQGPYKLCLIDMTTSQIHQMDFMRDLVKASNKITEIGGVLGCLLNAGDPTSIFMMPLLNMLEIIKYTELTLPGEIQLSFSQENFEHRLLTGGKMENQQVFENLQETFDYKIGKIAILCLTALLLDGILRMIPPISNGSKVVKLLKRCSFALQWNILASVFIGFFGDIILYSLVAFHHSENQFRILISLLVILPLVVFITTKLIRVSSEVVTDQEDKQRWRFVFEIYKSGRLSQRLFVLIFMMRVIFVSIIIGYLYECPVLQAVLLTAVNFGMLFYLLFASPIQKKFCFIQYIFIEVMLLFYNALVVILAVENDAQDANVGVKNTLGQLMMVFYLITPLLTATLIVLKLLYHVYSLNNKGRSSLSVRSSLDFIQLSEMSHHEEVDETSQIEAVNETDNNNDHDEEEEDGTIEPVDISV